MKRNTKPTSGQPVTDLNDDEEFIIAIRQGPSELDRGESLPLEDVERELPSWIIKYNA
jgi:predicted transcriptional regulator